MIEMLNILEPLDLGPPDSFESMHFIVEAMRHAYADRAAYLGDADFTPVPVARLTSRSVRGQAARGDSALQAGRAHCCGQSASV